MKIYEFWYDFGELYHVKIKIGSFLVHISRNIHKLII